MHMNLKDVVCTESPCITQIFKNICEMHMDLKDAVFTESPCTTQIFKIICEMHIDLKDAVCTESPCTTQIFKKGAFFPPLWGYWGILTIYFKIFA